MTPAAKPQPKSNLMYLHQWVTVTIIPLLLSVCVYFLIKIDKKVDAAYDGYIENKQQIIEHERRLNMLEFYVHK